MYVKLSNKEYNKMVAKIDRDVIWDRKRIREDSVMFFFEVGHIYVSRDYVSVVANGQKYHADLIRSFKDLKMAIKIAELASLLQ